MIKNPPANAGDVGSFPGLGRFPGKGNATHSSVLAWRIPWAGEPGRLQSTRSQDSDMTEHMWVLCAKSLQSCLTLCDPMDCSLPGSFVHGILRKEHWSELPFPSPEDLPDQGIKVASVTSPALTDQFLTTSTTWESRPICVTAPKFPARSHLSHFLAL